MVAAVPFPSLSASLLRRDFSLSPLLGASPTPTASINARRLSGVCVVPTDGANAQCFYIAIANALTIASETALDSRELRWPELHNRIRTALASINSAPLLASYSFDLDPTAGAEEVERAKANYLSSADFTRQQWGGSREMYLLSHFHSGQLAFRTFNSVAQATGDQPWRFLCAPPPSAVATVAVSATRPCGLSEEMCKPKREIALHHCAYRGGNHPNHFEQLTYTLSDGTSLSEWRISVKETPEDRDLRFRLIHAGCVQSRIRTATAAALTEKQNIAAAVAMQQQTPSPSKQRSPLKHRQQRKDATPIPVQHHPTKPPIRHRPAAKASTEFDASAAVPAATA